MLNPPTTDPSFWEQSRRCLPGLLPGPDLASPAAAASCDAAPDRPCSAARREETTSGRALTIRAVQQLRRLLVRLDAWPNPTAELWAGCIILVLSAGFWMSTGQDANLWSTVAGAILGPLLVYRAWKRKPSEVLCDTCGDRVPILDPSDEDGRFVSDEEDRFYVIDCRRCGAHRPRLGS